MKRAIQSLWLVILSASVAVAGAPGSDPTDAQPRAALLSDAPIALTLECPPSAWLPYDLTPTFALGRTRLYALTEQPPEALALSVALVRDRFEFVLSADLSEPLPRLDAIDGETYFSAGLRAHLTSTLSVFVEDFMTASTVVGSSRDYDLDPASEVSWDGHQVSVGAIATLSDAVSVRAEAVAYVASISERRDGVGARAALTVRF